jgi:hypothetical protein
MRRPKPSTIGFENVTFLSKPTWSDAIPAVLVPLMI